MCRKNQIMTAALVGFGIGLLVGGWIEWCFIRILLAMGAIGMGILLSGGKRWHK